MSAIVSIVCQLVYVESMTPSFATNGYVVMGMEIVIQERVLLDYLVE